METLVLGAAWMVGGLFVGILILFLVFMYVYTLVRCVQGIRLGTHLTKDLTIALLAHFLTLFGSFFALRHAVRVENMPLAALGIVLGLACLNTLSWMEHDSLVAKRWANRL